MADKIVNGATARHTGGRSDEILVVLAICDFMQPCYKRTHHDQKTYDFNAAIDLPARLARNRPSFHRGGHHLLRARARRLSIRIPARPRFTR